MSNLIEMDKLGEMCPKDFRNYMEEKQKELKIVIINSRELEYSIDSPQSKMDDNISNFIFGDVATLQRFHKKIEEIADIGTLHAFVIESNQADAEKDCRPITICHAEIIYVEKKRRASFFCLSKKSRLYFNMSFYNIIVKKI